MTAGAFELDHVIVCCDPGAPQAQVLARLGITEGSSNVHAGQGTANRRFFFRNAYVELLWVANLKEARTEPAFRTRLWERWVRRTTGACPFGIALRPSVPDAESPPPFPTWAYHAPYLPAQVAIGIALATPLTEPEFLYLPYATKPEAKHLEPLDHALGLRELTHVSVASPVAPHAPAAKAAAAAGLTSYERDAAYVATLTFDDGERNRTADLRPALPLVLRY